MPVALNLEILRQKMLLSAANRFSSANATIKTKQKILSRILQFTVLTQSEPPITVRETCLYHGCLGCRISEWH